jgi:hypothetical protein
MPSGQVSDFRDICLLIRHAGLLCGSCSSGQRFAFGFLPTIPHNTAVAVQLTLPPDGRVEDLHLQVGAPCRAHKEKAEPRTPHLLSLNEDIGAVSQEVKCGLKYAIYSPTKMIGIPSCYVGTLIAFQRSGRSMLGTEYIILAQKTHDERKFL